MEWLAVVVCTWLALAVLGWAIVRQPEVAERGSRSQLVRMLERIRSPSGKPFFAREEAQQELLASLADLDRALARERPPTRPSA